MRETNLSRIPVSTYRLQLNRGFPFAERSAWPLI